MIEFEPFVDPKEEWEKTLAAARSVSRREWLELSVPVVTAVLSLLFALGFMAWGDGVFQKAFLVFVLLSLASTLIVVRRVTATTAQWVVPNVIACQLLSIFFAALVALAAGPAYLFIDWWRILWVSGAVSCAYVACLLWGTPAKPQGRGSWAVLFVFPVVIVLVGCQVNTAWDDSEPSLHISRIVDKRAVRQKGRVSYSVAVFPLLEAKVPESLSISRTEYEVLSEGDEVLVSIRGGLLGAGWVSGLRGKRE